MRGFGFLTATHHLHVVSPPVQQHSQRRQMPISEVVVSEYGGPVTTTSSSSTTATAAAGGGGNMETKQITFITAEGEKVVDTKSNGVGAGGNDLQAWVERTSVSLGDIFVHQSYIQMQGFRALSIGDRVVFRIGILHGREAHQAVSVQRIGEQDKSSAATEASAFAAGHGGYNKGRGTHMDEKKGKQDEKDEEEKKKKRDNNNNNNNDDDEKENGNVDKGKKMGEKENKKDKEVVNGGEKIVSEKFSAGCSSCGEQDVESLAIKDESRRNVPKTHDSLHSPNIIDPCQVIGDCQSGFGLTSFTFGNENMFFPSGRNVDIQDVSQHVNEQSVLPDVNEFCDLFGSFVRE